MSLANLFDLSGQVAVVTAATAALAVASPWVWRKRELPLQFWRETRERTKPSSAS
jgi:hypothetical protein